MLESWIEITETDIGLIEKQLFKLHDEFTTPLSILFSDNTLVYVRTKNDLGYLLIGIQLMRES